MKSRSNPFLRPAALAASIVLWLGQAAHATTAYWDGSQGTGAWSTVANWSTVSGATTPDPSGVPDTSDTAYFDSAGNSQTSITLGADRTLNGLSFSLAACAAYTFNAGYKFIFVGGGNITVNKSVTNSQTIHTDIQLGSSAGASTYNINNYMSSAQSLTVGGTITGGSGGTTGAKTLGVAVGGGGKTILSGIISNGGASSLALTKSDVGTLTLSGTSPNTYTGLTTVNAGELNIQSAGAIGGSQVTVTSGQLALQGVTIANTKTITVIGSGTNVYGAIQSTSGISEWQGAVTIGAASTRIGVNAGTFTVSGAIDSGVNNYGVAFRPNTGTLVLSGANTYLGDTTIIATGGLVQLSGGANRLPTTTKLIMGISTVSGILDLNGQNQEVAGLSVGQASGTFANQVKSATPATFTVNTATDSTYSGKITGAIDIVKMGNSNFILQATNTYTGNTTVNAGTLQLADNAQLRFVIGATSGTNNSISGSGNALLNGDFAIDITAAAALTSGSWTLENVSTLTGAYESTFQVVNTDGSPWTNAGSDKWTKDGGADKTWTFDETTGTLTLTLPGGYTSWASANGAAGQAVDQDHDLDGVANGVEYFMGATGTTFTANPALIGDTITWPKNPLFNGSYRVVTSSNLVLWADVTGSAVDDGTSVVYTLTGSPSRFLRLVVIPN